MSSLSSSLKQWGATGSEYPNGYNYLEGEQPVDEWDNFLTYNLIEEVHALQSVVNDRMESDVTGGGSHPGSPEVGHVSHRTDPSNLPSSDEATFVYDGSNSVWHRLMQADGDTMTGVLDMGGYKIHDTQGRLTLGGNVGVSGNLEVTGARLDHEWHQKQEGGTVAAGTAVPIGTFKLGVDETLAVTQAMLNEDGFTTPAAADTSLLIVPDGSANVTIQTADGNTNYLDLTGTPLSSYTNAGSEAQAVAIMLDNGQYRVGAGADVQLYGGYTARVE
jgi:hypothetical protein